MTQTATFQDLESFPKVSDYKILDFSSTMGTLTEVDLVTSGSFKTEFYAENLGASSSTIEGTTSGNLSINGPTGAIPVTIPSVTETFDAGAFDGTVDYGGTSGKDFAPVTSSSTPQTTVLTSPADLAAFSGQVLMPITVSGHATGSASSSNGDLSDGFKTQTSATITVIYHYIPNLPSLDPSPNTSPTEGTGSSGSPASSSNSGTVSSSNSGTASVPGASNPDQTPSTQPPAAATVSQKHGPLVTRTTSRKGGHHSSARPLRPVSGGHPRVVKALGIHDARHR